jgi:predicted GIY-YIG superfamily endonuclease
MPKETTVTLKGASGRSYDFDVYPWGTSFKAVGAVYTVLKGNGTNFTILYIGQTGDLPERFDNHHKRACFDRNGKTHIGIHLESVESGRLAIETDLVRNYKLVCND